MRIPIPDEIAALVLFQHDRTCCICNEPGKAHQIHHIDDNPANNDPDNLSVLCLQHHNDTQVQGGFGRKLRPVDVKISRDDWISRVAARRAAADQVLLERMVAAPKPDTPHWSRPSDQALETFIQNLPAVFSDICRKAEPLLSSVVRGDMIEGAQIVTDVLEQSWIRLAAWFPPNHFGGVPAAEYISRYLSDRFVWHLAFAEPEGPGSGGREAGILAHGGVMQDAENLILETVQEMGARDIEDFDFELWKKKWEAAKS